VTVASSEFLQGLREITSASGALLMVDEVQTGIWRTGKFLGVDHSGVKADAVALAKGMGGGVPIGAMLCREALAKSLPPGSHGSTFGGGPLASAAALAVLDTIEKENLDKKCVELGDYLSQSLRTLAEKHSVVTGTRGIGLLQALVLSDQIDMKQLVAKLRDAGILLTLAGGIALRFSPPLIVTKDQIDEGMAIVDRVLGDF
jgi:acetylornithine/succinyldiaminopimelate/putrescine aminotransferase